MYMSLAISSSERPRCTFPTTGAPDTPRSTVEMKSNISRPYVPRQPAENAEPCSPVWRGVADSTQQLADRVPYLFPEKGPEYCERVANAVRETLPEGGMAAFLLELDDDEQRATMEALMRRVQGGPSLKDVAEAVTANLLDAYTTVCQLLSGNTPPKAKTN